MRLALLSLALVAIAASPRPLSGLVAVASPHTQTQSVAEQLTRVAETLNQPPVDARVDRVWHAIPGLSGWVLDVAQSERDTLAASDGMLHLVWRSAPPDRRLADLPPEPIYRGPKEEKAVSLMFNVSWGESYVPSILDTLRRAGVRATFFLDGAWVEKHPDLAKRIAAEGHAIGSHGRGHPDFRRLSADAQARNLVSTNETLQHTLGTTTDLFAPPAGSFDARTVETARRLGMYTILWTADTIDWRRPPASVIVDRVRRGLEPGALILMHPTEQTAEALPAILKLLDERGYQVKTVEAVVHEQRALAPPNAMQRM
ncbi:polysaccharide deacetylase family protein [Alicyclobacillus sp.]|uniref:polysaccharide deacetylase family protein n=1 Tax=Alicyclobacillus sp. TaxID=61169 RepID=UPI0025C4556F|nr:polysaccharide deacetylase family protein [Alicyclobacillus sp.]MCL6516214.1 polysaccharide deacetylase family protein [Alicyclobacillus sp.]